MPTVNYLGSESNGELGNYDSVFIAVYDTDAVPSGYLDAAFDYAIDCMENVYSRGYVSGYKISKRSVNNWTPDCCADPSVINQWDNLRDQLSLTRRGDHCLIHTCSQTKCGVASGTTNGDNAWKTDMGSVGTIDRENFDTPKSEAGMAETIMHEVLHAHCRSNLCPKVDDDTDGSEHHLGIIRKENGVNKETPFGSKKSADDGSCVSESVVTNGFTSNLSLCEASAMQDSAEHTAGYHDCSNCTR